MSCLHFFVNDKEVRLDDYAPTETLLDYLRLNLRLTGSKEGCAEGDCGACTVVLASLDDDKLKLRSVNSCILLLPMLHGKWVITIDYLAQQQDLHPLQQAFVDAHASQCGFCTPGFIMALYPLYYQRTLSVDDNAIEDAIAGNLCRCTGYRSIMQATRSALQGSEADHISAQSAPMLEQLRQIKPSSPQSTTSGQQCWTPQSTAELLQIRSQHPDATLVAGATDVGLWITKQRRELTKLIFLDQVNELNFIERSDDELIVGANVAYAEAHESLGDYFPALGALLYRWGAQQVRNSGTLVGNIANASPVGDGSPGFLALGGKLQIASVRGERELELEDFFLDYQKTALRPDEIIRSLRLPALRADEHFRAYKISKRFDQDISAVLMACRWRQQGETISSIRIAFGGMAAIPQRAYALEQWLLGRELAACQGDEVPELLAQDFTPINDMRASAAYRMLVASNLIGKIYLEREHSGCSQLYELARRQQLAALS